MSTPKHYISEKLTNDCNIQTAKIMKKREQERH